MSSAARTEQRHTSRPGSGADPFEAAVVLAVGPEELLAERVVETVVAGARRLDPDIELEKVEGPDLSSIRLAGLLSPSLFSAARVLAIGSADQLRAEVAEALLAACAGLPDGCRVVVRHPGGSRGKGLLDRLRALGAGLIGCDRPRPGELPGFVAQEVRRGGGEIARDAAVLLVDAVGADLRALSAAAAQLVADTISDTGGRPTVSRELVATYYGGHAQVSGFQIADAVLEGRTPEAVDRLRWALRTGVAPVLLVSAFATGVRSLLRYSGLSRGVGEGEAARVLGVPPWKVRTIRAQAAGWPAESLARAQVAVAEADAAVKGAGADQGFALERLVMRLAALRQSPPARPRRH